jgi:lipopolysaccharide/colanic/teichoic acid biosynthesis glycosyltransferase
MGLIAAILAFVSLVAVATLSRLFADEAKSWIPYVTGRMIDQAVAKLSVEQRERYAEEWRADLDQIPGDLGKLLVAASFRFAATRMARPLTGEAVSGWIEISSRITDVVLSAGMLFLFTPLMAFAALAIRLDSKGPLLVGHSRVGVDGRLFVLWKFRTRRVDAISGVSTGNKPRDVRMTRVGRFLRRTRLDELPELFNVLKGDMSIVGPRPDRPQTFDRVCKELPGYAERSQVKPGITGLAQVNNRYHISTKNARAILVDDMQYIRNRSITLNLHILLRTLVSPLFN